MPLSIDLRNLKENVEFADLYDVKTNGKMTLVREDAPLYYLDGKGTHIIQTKRIRSSCSRFGVGTMMIVRIAAVVDIKEKTFSAAPKIMLLFSETNEKKMVKIFKRALKKPGAAIKITKKARPYYHRNRFLGEIIEEAFYIY